MSTRIDWLWASPDYRRQPEHKYLLNIEAHDRYYKEGGNASYYDVYKWLIKNYSPLELELMRQDAI